MRRTTVILAAAATLGMLALGTSAASAAPRPLPEGDTLYALPCNYYSADVADLPTLQLLDVDTTTAAATAIGTGTEIADVDCAGQGAWDATTNTAYAIAYSWGVGGDALLIKVDLATGVSTVVAPFTDAEGETDVYSIAIDAEGNAFASYDGLYSLDLDTAKITYVGGSVSNYGLAFDPTSGVLHTLNSSGILSTVDTVSGATNPLGDITDVGSTYSLAIDSAGVVWFGIDVSLPGDGYEVIIASVDSADLTSFEESGTLTVGEVAPFQEALLIAPDVAPAPAPEPVLAATGSGVDTSLLIGAGILGLVGIGLVARRRRAA